MSIIYEQSVSRVETLNKFQELPLYESHETGINLPPIGAIRYQWRPDASTSFAGRIIKIRIVDNYTLLVVKDASGFLVVRLPKELYDGQVLTCGDIVEVVGICCKGRVVIAQHFRVVAIPHILMSGTPRMKGKDLILAATLHSAARRFLAQHGFMEIVGGHDGFDALNALTDGVPRGFILNSNLLYVFNAGWIVDNARAYFQLILNTLQAATLRRALPPEIPIVSLSDVMGPRIVFVENVLGGYCAVRDGIAQRYELRYNNLTLGTVEEIATDPERFNEKSIEFGFWRESLWRGVPPYSVFSLNMQLFQEKVAKAPTFSI